MKVTKIWLTGLGVCLVAALWLGGCAQQSRPAEPVAVDSSGVNTLTPRQAFDLIQAHRGDPSFMIIDDQPAAQFKKLHISDAVNIYLNTLNEDAFRSQSRVLGPAQEHDPLRRAQPAPRREGREAGHEVAQGPRVID